MAQHSSGSRGNRPVAIVVHGGAWAIPDELSAASEAGARRAANVGYGILVAGGSALDAVEAAVRVLEDDPAFDAGTGSVLNKDGNVELDALIMDGESLGVGAVTCVTGVRNPISLARLVMERTEHCMLAGVGARRFADEMGIAVTPDQELTTEATRSEYRSYQKYGSAVRDIFGSTIPAEELVTTAEAAPGRISEGATVEPSTVTRGSASAQPLGHDTVGAVAIDNAGNIASATSTGGITLKRPGRVGDSPLVGCGGYADNLAGGCSATGHGEALLRYTASSRAVALMAAGVEPSEAARQCLHAMHARTGGRGGLIVVGADGRVGHHGTTRRMAWAAAEEASGGVVRSGVDNQEAFEELTP